MGILRVVNGNKPRITSPSGFVDGGGNVFIATTEYNDQNRYNGNVAIYKLATDGTLSLVHTSENIEGKGDDNLILQTGADILVFGDTHVGDPQTDFEQLPSVLGVCTPYPNGHAPFGKEGAYLGGDTPPPPPPPDPVDYARIQAGDHTESVAEEAEIRSEFGGNVRQGLLDKAHQGDVAALTEAGLESNSLRTRGIDQWDMDRVYQVFVDNAGPNFWPKLRAWADAPPPPKP